MDVAIGTIGLISLLTIWDDRLIVSFKLQSLFQLQHYLCATWYIKASSFFIRSQLFPYFFFGLLAFFRPLWTFVLNLNVYNALTGGSYNGTQVSRETRPFSPIFVGARHFKMEKLIWLSTCSESSMYVKSSKPVLNFLLSYIPSEHVGYTMYGHLMSIFIEVGSHWRSIFIKFRCLWRAIWHWHQIFDFRCFKTRK